MSDYCTTCYRPLDAEREAAGVITCSKVCRAIKRKLDAADAAADAATTDTERKAAASRYAAAIRERQEVQRAAGTLA